MGCSNCIIVRFALHVMPQCHPNLAFYGHVPSRLCVSRGQGLQIILVRLRISITLPWTPETDVKYINNWINGLLTNEEVGSLCFTGWSDLLNVFKQPAVSPQSTTCNCSDLHPRARVDASSGPWPRGLLADWLSEQVRSEMPWWWAKGLERAQCILFFPLFCFHELDELLGSSLKEGSTSEPLVLETVFYLNTSL